jgi:hypothetical protein
MSYRRRPGSAEGAYTVWHLYDTQPSYTERSDTPHTLGQRLD